MQVIISNLSGVEIPEGGGHVKAEVVPAETVLLTGPHPGPTNLTSLK